MPKAPCMSLCARIPPTLHPASLQAPTSLFIPKSTSGYLDTPASPPGTSSAPLAPSAALRVWNLPQPPSCLGPHPPGSCSGCGSLSLPVLAGLMAADALVSLFIIAVVFACACPRHRPTLGEGRDRAGPGGRGVPRAAGVGSPGRGPPGKPWRRFWGNPGGGAGGNSGGNP